MYVYMYRFAALNHFREAGTFRSSLNYLTAINRGVQQCTKNKVTKIFLGVIYIYIYISHTQKHYRKKISEVKEKIID